MAAETIQLAAVGTTMDMRFAEQNKKMETGFTAQLRLSSPLSHSDDLLRRNVGTLEQR